MNATPQRTPSRTVYAISGVLTVGLGLIWRSSLLPISPFLTKYGGDALWALLVFFLVRFIQPRTSVVLSALVAFGFSVCIEASQLYHAPWIDLIRGTRLGSLILGNTFNWPDIPAYAVGIVLGALIEVAAQLASRGQAGAE
jgi:hypothetical protein